MEVIFAKTRYDYTSYSDYWKLVELSNFKTCFVDDIHIDLPCIYITAPINGEFRPHISGERNRVPPERRKAKVIWHNLERPDSGNWKLETIGNGASNEVDEITKYVDYVWSSDRWFASLDPRMVYVTLGSHPGLCPAPVSGLFEYHIAHLSYVVARRSFIYGAVAKNFSVAPCGWDDERHRILDHSLVMLNVHQTPFPIIEPLRFALAAAYSMPMITEEVNDPYPLERDVHLISAPYSDLPEVVKARLTETGRLRQIGKNLHQKLCQEITFRNGVEDAIARIGL